jgi:toxin ParE1/3/4
MFMTSQMDVAKNAGVQTAAKYTALFDSLYDRLAKFPDSGSPRPGLGKDIRVGIVFPYIVICRHRIDDNTVTVLRVIHGRRHITEVDFRLNDHTASKGSLNPSYAPTRTPPP